MAINFDENLNKIISLIKSDGKKSCKIIYVKGDFGVGKTELIYSALNLLYSEKAADVFLHIDHSQNFQYIYEFCANVLFSYKNVHDKTDNLNPNETLYLRNSFFDFLNKTYKIDEAANYTAKNNNWLRSIPEVITDLDIGMIDYEKKEDPNFSSYKKSELALMFKSFDLLAEAFIIDLFNKFYNPGDLPSPIVPPGNPIKILISLDDIDGYAGTIFYWLVNYLFKFCYKFNFFEFKNFDVSLYAKDRKISDYFDFRFILSGRNKFYKSEEIDDLEIINLFPFSPADVEAFFYKENIKNVDNVKDIIKITKGNPYVLSLTAEALKVGSLDGEELMRVDQLAVKKACRFLSEEQYDWLRCAAFIDEFDENTLKYFPFVGSKSEYVFKFLSNAGDICIKINNSNKLKVNPNIKDFIINTLTLESAQVAKELEKLAADYKKYHDFINYYDAKERDYIHKLAYFRRFDKIYAIQDLFGNDAAYVRKIIENHPELFIEKNSIYEMHETAVEIILNIEKKAGRDEFDIFNKMIIESWAKYSIDLLKNVESLDKQLELEQKEIEYSNNKINNLTVEIESSNSRIEESDRKLHDFNLFADEYIKSGSGNTGLLSGIVGVLLIVLYLLPGASNALKEVFLLAGIGAISFGVYKFVIKMKLKSKEPEFLKVSKQIHELEAFRAELEKDRDIKLEEKRRLERKIKDLTNSGEQIKQDVALLKSKLEEPFVREN